MKNIDEIIEMLSEDNSFEMQREGMILARNINLFKVFFQPQYGKDVKKTWKNCAKIVCEKSDKELELFFRDLFFLLRDLENPGALIVLNRLNNFSVSNSFVRSLREFKKMALAIDDQVWYDNLCRIEL